MKEVLQNLSEDQLAFLAVLYAAESDIALDVAEKISPILLGSFLDLMGRNHKRALIQETQNARVSLLPSPPQAILEQIKGFVLSGGLAALLDKQGERELKAKIPHEILSNLYANSGQYKKLTELEKGLAEMALKSGNQKLAVQHFLRAMNKLSVELGSPEVDQEFVIIALKLWDICVEYGSWPPDSGSFLEKALKAADRVGDRRSYALLNLDLYFYYRMDVEKRERAWQALKDGLEEVESLGDEDILRQSAPVLGLYFYVQGLFKEAERHLERCVCTADLYETENLPAGRVHSSFLLGVCMVHLGHFHDAVGYFECLRRIGRRLSHPTLAAASQALLGEILEMAAKGEEATRQFDSAIKLAEQTSNVMAKSIVNLCLSHQKLLKGFPVEATAIFRELIENREARPENLVNVPYLQHMLIELHHESGLISPNIYAESMMSWTTCGANAYLKGIAYRLMADEIMKKSNDIAQAQTCLEKSEEFLLKTGDSLQLSRTWIEMAQMALRQENPSTAQVLAKKAYEGFPRPAKGLYPADLRPLLKKANKETPPERYKELLNRLMMIFDSNALHENIDDMLERTLKFICRLLAAERSVLFRIENKSRSQHPEYWVGRNITPLDLQETDFADSLALIHGVIKRKSPMRQQFLKNDQQGDSNSPTGALCLPLFRGRDLFALLYLDNIFLESEFNLLDDPTTERLAEFMSRYIEQLVAFDRIREEQKVFSSVTSSQLDKITKEEIIHKSQVMSRLLSQVDQIASTESTVLIQGESGVGKELLAARIHSLSKRKAGPFEIIELTSIPENLLESELVGYEKGAFTGANHQKRGRVELAHNGTLFLDEIGEIPASFQAKLLRIIQEKSFKRLGGIQTLSSDFRLIAATNKDLQTQVEAGHFRQDLFYRLNVFNIVVPPLRDRDEDVVVLAQHFLSKYMQKYQNHNIAMTEEDIGILRAYPWPGNIRELKNVMERAVLLSRNGRLDLGSLQGANIKVAGSMNPQLVEGPDHQPNLFQNLPTLADMEKRYILHVLDRTGGKLSGPGGASEVLGMKRETLYGRMKRLGIK
jgi:transcriptional regulator with GAF, ATPase, and Fis domain/tetratricopeptide (TPR) repeat protein